MVNKELSDEFDDRNGVKSPSMCPICQNPADKKCSACHSVSYCSSEHQKRHWKSHKRTCRSFTIKHNDSYGRFLVATRDIAQGATIFTEEPLAYGPKRCTYPVCLGCHNRLYDGSYRCSSCTYPMCSEECEKARIHAENECLIFQRATHPVGSKITNFDSICPAYECVTPLRCLLLKKQNPVKWEKLVSMEHHNELRKTVPGLWNRNQVNVVKLLLEWYKMKDEFNEEEIHSVMGFIDVNAFEIKFGNIEICGVYRDAGLMCHDCQPNTHNAISTDSEHKMLVRASIPIRKGEMITTSYANQLTGTRDRRHYLKDTKYFDCFCKRCQDPLDCYISAVKCPDCSTGYLLPKDSMGVHSTDWVCSNSDDTKGTSFSSESETVSRSNGTHARCIKSMKEEQVQTILKKAKKDIDEVSRSTSGSTVSRLERLLKKYSGKILHSNHYLLLNVIKSLNYAYAKTYTTANDDDGGADGKEESSAYMDRLQRAKSLCLQLLSVLDMIDPGLTRLRGVTLFQMSLSDFQICCLKLQRNELTQEEYKEAVSNILAYLKTAKDILVLDQFVSPNAILNHKVVNQIETLEAALEPTSSQS